MVSLLLNLTEIIGVMLTFKPFPVIPPQYKWERCASDQAAPLQAG
jgi:hypothetical protein